MNTPINLPKAGRFKLKDMTSILADSRRQQDQVFFIQSLINDHGIKNFSYSVLENDFSFGVVTSIPSNELLSYYNSQIWKIDNAISFSHMRSFQLIDYTKDFSYSFVKKYADSIGNKISIISTQIILDKKYSFTFDIDRKYFSRLREKNGFFNLYKIIDAAISLIYAKLRITTFFRIDADDLPKKDADQVIDATIVHPFLAELTSTELDYLKMIVSGCTAKEMAIHMNKSYRTVQTMIANMLKKLKLENKEELILVAKIVM